MDKRHSHEAAKKTEVEDIADQVLFDGRSPFEPLPKRSLLNSIVSDEEDFNLSVPGSIFGNSDW